MGLEKPKLKTSGCLINSKTQETFELKHNMTIGRGNDAAVVINDLKMSRIHLTVLFDNSGNVWIQDSSTNGTFVDGERILGKIKITADTKLKIGNTEMLLAMPAIDSSEKAVPRAAGTKSLSSPAQPLKLVKNYTESFENYPPAPTFRRFVSVAIDGIILSLLCKIPDVILLKMGLSEVIVKFMTFISYTGISLSYYYISLNKDGQTIGKKAMKLKVIRTNKTTGFSPLEILGREIIIKNLLGTISVLTVLFTSEKMAVHDYLLKTRVIDISKK